MAFILLSENCKGSNIEFIEQDGKLLSRSAGKQYSGTLALQDLGDGNRMRITFADTKNVLTGAVKKIFGITKAVYDENPFGAFKRGNADYLCHFDFSKSELRSGKKKLECQMQVVGITVFSSLFCYDFGDHTGCCYMFSDDNDVNTWAKTLDMKEIELLDAEGNSVGTIPVK